MDFVTLDELHGLVRQQLRGKGDGAPFTEDRLLSDLGLSSLQITEVVFELEEAHDVEFDSSRAAEIQTVGDVIVLANEAITGAGAPR